MSNFKKKFQRASRTKNYFREKSQKIAIFGQKLQFFANTVPFLPKNGAFFWTNTPTLTLKPILQAVISG